MAMRRSLLLAGLASAMPAHAQTPVTPGLMGYAGTLLAEVIESAREHAIADGVRPVPPAVYRALLGYFPPALLHRVRFAVGGARKLSLPMLAFTYGDAQAMTVGDVILFKTENMAASDLHVWAHELTHVMQYQRWGIEGFADRYVRDSAAIEQEAIDNANRCSGWLSRHRTGAA